MKRFALLLVMITALVALPSAEIYGQHFEMKLGAGSTFSPQTFLMLASADYRADDYFSFGPTLLWGIGSRTDLINPSLGGRFIVPRGFWAKRALGNEQMGFELSFPVMAGVLFRTEDNGFVKFNFTEASFGVGVEGDVLINDLITLGLGTRVHVTGGALNRTFLSTYGSVGLRF